MNLHRILRGRSLAIVSAGLVALATLAALAGQVAASQPAGVLAPPPLIDKWKSPRIRISTDGWRQFQNEGGVSLEPSKIYDLDITAGQAVTFNWSAHPRSGQGEIVGYRWAVDMVDITDETPRLGPDDVTHWSQWSSTETSATAGPFNATAEPHYFYVEARDNLGFVSLVTVRLTTRP